MKLIAPWLLSTLSMCLLARHSFAQAMDTRQSSNGLPPQCQAVKDCETQIQNSKDPLTPLEALLIRDFTIGGYGGYTNKATSTTGQNLNPDSVGIAIDATYKYGMVFGFKDKPIVSQIVDAWQGPTKPPANSLNDIVSTFIFKPFKLTATFGEERQLESTTKGSKVTFKDQFPVQPTYNVSVSYDVKLEDIYTKLIVRR